MAEHSDAIVVGAGPAGCVFAARFADEGGRVVLVDGSGPSPKPCGGALPWDVLAESSASGRLLVPYGSSPPCVEFESAEGESESLPLEPHSMGVIDRGRLDRTLREEAEASGARLVRGRATMIHRAEGRWRLAVGGSILTADVLVGADGVAGSQGVRALCGLPPARAVWARVASARGAGSDLPLRVRTLPVPGYCWYFPGPEVSTVGYLVVEHRHLEAPELRSAFGRFVSDAVGESELGAELTAPIPYLDRVDVAMPISGANWVVVGDAAGLGDPITGAGLAAALETGRLAAGAVLGDFLGGVGPTWWLSRAGQGLTAAITAFASAIRIGGAAGLAAYQALLRQAFGGRPPSETG